MHYKGTFFCCVAACMFGFAGSLAAKDGQFLPVSDPYDLQKMGMSPDAENVFTASGATEHAHEETNYLLKRNFGPLVTFHTISPRDFVGRQTNDWGSNGSNLYCESGEPFYDAPIHLPHGSRLRFVRWWGADFSAEDMQLFVFEVCLPDFAAGSQVSNQLLTNVSSGTSGGNFSNSQSMDQRVDNQSCEYKVRVRFDDGAVSCSEGTNMSIYKVRFEWNRDVSPAPGTATFNDVGTGHPFFQSVEALVNAGVTGGCGGGNYCPDNTVTRGQMAAFISRALGISWSTISDPAN